MAVYIVTGKLGNGKTLCSVGRIRDYLQKGARVATNLDLKLHNMFGRKARNMEVIRIPDKPSIYDLECIGKGYEGPYDESKFGLLVLDECGTWFNSRNWNDKTRQAVNDWFLHARKLRWEVLLIVQDVEILDSMARRAIAEHTVFCRRLDRVRIPLISPLIKMVTTFNLTLPRIHRAKVCYGISPTDLVTDVWVYRGNDLFACYDTDQLFLESYSSGPYCYLSPWHLYGRYQKPMNWRRFMRITKIYWKRFKSPVALATGILLGISAMLLKISVVEPVQASPQVQVVQPEQTKESERIEENEHPVIALARRLRIAGSMQINGQYQYDLVDRDNPDYQLSSREFFDMGATVRPRSSCALEVHIAGEKQAVYCSL